MTPPESATPEEGGTCNVCGGGVRYGDRHVKCGRAVMDLETRLRAAEAEIAAICNHHCESQGCALPDGYTETAKRYADSFHAMKSERDQARATIATLTGQLAEAQRDARRYRFLRRLDAKGIQVYDGSNDRSIFGDELDAAIDAAIAKDDTHGNG